MDWHVDRRLAAQLRGSIAPRNRGSKAEGEEGWAVWVQLFSAESLSFDWADVPRLGFNLTSAMMWATASSFVENSVAPLSLGYPVLVVDPSSRWATLLPLKTMALAGTAIYLTWLGKHSSKVLLGCCEREGRCDAQFTECWRCRQDALDGAWIVSDSGLKRCNSTIFVRRGLPSAKVSFLTHLGCDVSYEIALTLSAHERLLADGALHGHARSVGGSLRPAALIGVSKN